MRILSNIKILYIKMGG